MKKYFSDQKYHFLYEIGAIPSAYFLIKVIIDVSYKIDDPWLSMKNANLAYLDWTLAPLIVGRIYMFYVKFNLKYEALLIASSHLLVNYSC